jgi:hypothetical protein
MLSSYRYYLDMFQTEPNAAVKYLSQGEAPRDAKLNPTELAAYSTVASLILNLDETVSKE